MGTTYQEIIDNFIKMVKEYKFLKLEETDRDQWVIDLLNSACSKFYKKCASDLTTRTETGFEATLTSDEIDILCNLMIVEWLKPYLFSVENFENVMSTKDYSMYSPANILKEIKNTYEVTRLNCKRLMTDYTYTLRKYKRGTMYD